MNVQQLRTIDITIHLSGQTAEHVRREVAKGHYSSPEDYLESLLTSDSLFTSLHARELTDWINTEGVRRLHEMKAHPDRTLNADEVFGENAEEVIA